MMQKVHSFLQKIFNLKKNDKDFYLRLKQICLKIKLEVYPFYSLINLAKLKLS